MHPAHEIWICQNRNCIAQGADVVLAEFVRYTQNDADIQAIGCECQGQCNMSPTVRVMSDETWYCRVKPEDVPQVVEQHLKQGQPVKKLLHPRWHPQF